MSDSQRTKQVIGNILSYIAIGLIIAAQANTFWFFTNIAGSVIASLLETRYGLYQRCFSNNCFSYDWVPDSTEEYAAFVTRIVLIVVDAFVGVAFVTGFVAFGLSDEQRQTCLKTTGAFNIVGGSLSIIAAIVYIALAVTAFFARTITGLAVGSSFNTGYCYIFCWIAAICFIVGGALQISSATPSRVIQPEHTTVIMTTQHSTALPTITTIPSGYGRGYYNSRVTSYPNY